MGDQSERWQKAANRMTPAPRAPRAKDGLRLSSRSAAYSQRVATFFTSSLLPLPPAEPDLQPRTGRATHEPP